MSDVERPQDTQELPKILPSEASHAAEMEKFYFNPRMNETAKNVYALGLNAKNRDLLNRVIILHEAKQAKAALELQAQPEPSQETPVRITTKRPRGEFVDKMGKIIAIDDSANEADKAKNQDVITSVQTPIELAKTLYPNAVKYESYRSSLHPLLFSEGFTRDIGRQHIYDVLKVSNESRTFPITGGMRHEFENAIKDTFTSNEPIFIDLEASQEDSPKIRIFQIKQNGSDIKISKMIEIEREDILKSKQEALKKAQEKAAAEPERVKTKFDQDAETIKKFVGNHIVELITKGSKKEDLTFDEILKKIKPSYDDEDLTHQLSFDENSHSFSFVTTPKNTEGRAQRLTGRLIRAFTRQEKPNLETRYVFTVTDKDWSTVNKEKATQTIELLNKQHADELVERLSVDVRKEAEVIAKNNNDTPPIVQSINLAISDRKKLLNDPETQKLEPADYAVKIWKMDPHAVKGMTSHQLAKLMVTLEQNKDTALKNVEQKLIRDELVATWHTQEIDNRAKAVKELVQEISNNPIKNPPHFELTRINILASKDIVAKCDETIKKAYQEIFESDDTDSAIKDLEKNPEKMALEVDRIEDQLNRIEYKARQTFIADCRHEFDRRMNSLIKFYNLGQNDKINYSEYDTNSKKLQLIKRLQNVVNIAILLNPPGVYRTNVSEPIKHLTQKGYKNARLTNDDSRDIYAMSQYFVDQQLKTPEASQLPNLMDITQLLNNLPEGRQKPKIRFSDIQMTLSDEDRDIDVDDIVSTETDNRGKKTVEIEIDRKSLEVIQEAVKIGEQRVASEDKYSEAMVTEFMESINALFKNLPMPKIDSNELGNYNQTAELAVRMSQHKANTELTISYDEALYLLRRMLKAYETQIEQFLEDARETQRQSTQSAVGRLKLLDQPVDLRYAKLIEAANNPQEIERIKKAVEAKKKKTY